MSYVIDEEKFQKFSKFSHNMYNLSESNMDDCNNFILQLIQDYNWPAIHLFRMIDIILIRRKENIRLYFDLVDLIYQTTNPVLDQYIFDDSSIVGAYISKRYNQYFKFNAYSNCTIEQIIQVYPKDSILYYILRDDIENFIQGFTFDIETTFDDMTCASHAAKYGAVKIFKFLVANDAVISKDTLADAFITCNQEIIKICENAVGIGQFDQDCMNNAMMFHHNEIAINLADNYNLKYSWWICQKSMNVDLFRYILEEHGPNYCDSFMYTIAQNVLFIEPFNLYSFIDVGARDVFGRNILSCSILYDQVELAKLLVNKYHSSFGLIDRDGNNHLHKCADYNAFKCAKYFIELGIEMEKYNNQGETCLLRVARYGAKEVAQVLIDNGADLRAKHQVSSFSVLSICSQYDSFEIAAMIFEKAKFTAEEMSHPFRVAIAKGSLKMAQLLLDNGAVLDSPFLLLSYCIKHDIRESVVFLVQHGVDPNHSLMSPNDNALIVCAQFKRFELARYFIDLGVDINAQKGDRKTPLMQAIEVGAKDIARLLIQSGCDLTLTDNLHLTALEYCKVFGANEILELIENIRQN